MTELPSLFDLIIVITFFLPGFIAMYLMRYIGILERRLDKLEIICWSLLSSLLINSLFIYILKVWLGFDIPSFNELRTILLVPEFLAIFVGLILVSAIIGSLIGLLIKHTLRQGVYRGDAWRYLCSQYRRLSQAARVVIYTVDGKEYEGYLVGMPDENAPSKDIVIAKPFEIIRDDEGKQLYKVELGIADLFIRENNIKAIAFMSPVISIFQENPRANHNK